MLDIHILLRSVEHFLRFVERKHSRIVIFYTIVLKLFNILFPDMNMIKLLCQWKLYYRASSPREDNCRMTLSTQCCGGPHTIKV